jgi:para-aminobenzoate synthetase component I
MEKLVEKIETIAGQPDGVYVQSLDLKESFIEMASRFAHLPGTVLLMSGGDLDCARHHILGINPWLIYRVRGQTFNLKLDQTEIPIHADPFECLRHILRTFHIDEINISDPICSGLLGYLSYDLKDVIEKLPRTSVDTLNLPHILLYAPSALIVYDRFNNTCRLFIPKRKFADKIIEEKDQIEKQLEAIEKIFKENPPVRGAFSGNPEGFKSNIAKSDYIRSVEKIIEYIKAGHVYQVNMSQRFEMQFSGDSFTLFKHLFRLNPAPFFAYVNAGDHQIISTSPERFLLMDKKQVETRPIKGTRPRGKNFDEDIQFRTELLNSPKDDAELSMIVDLLRNDIGKVCRAASVRVKEHKRLEAYENVYHLISIVEGILDEGLDAVDLIRATFPGGSITGCPKIRAMEIIDELESCRRHVYTGSIGYISFHDTMDLSIAIRTATIFENKIYFSVGGGIVYDSEPENEFEETLHKGRTLIDVFSDGQKHFQQSPMVWINGALSCINMANVSVNDEGFQYGNGFFETIRVDKGIPCFLDKHMERFYKAWRELFPDEPPDLTWDDIIAQVIEANALEKSVASIKISATRGSGDYPAQNRTLLAMAKPYIHRLKQKNAIGLKLITYPEARQSPLADHKSLNYLYYLNAGRWACKNGADEALVLNANGSVSETNTANILLINEKSVIIPQSLHVLPGIFQSVTLDLLSSWGYHLKHQKVFHQDLFDAEMAILTNSLMGAVPIICLDEKNLNPATIICEKINKVMLESGERLYIVPGFRRNDKKMALNDDIKKIADNCFRVL